MDDITAASPRENRSRLLELPAELRVRIYEYIYNDDDLSHCRLVINKTPTIHRFGPLVRHAEISPFSAKILWAHIPPHFQCQVSTSLVQTCRTIYREAMPLLYNTVVFHLWVYGGSFWDIDQSLKNLGLISSWATIPQIQHLELKLLGNEDYERALGIGHIDRFVRRTKENTVLKTCKLNTRALPGPLVWEDIQRMHVVKKWCETASQKAEMGSAEALIYEKVLERIHEPVESTHVR